MRIRKAAADLSYFTNHIIWAIGLEGSMSEGSNPSLCGLGFGWYLAHERLSKVFLKGYLIMSFPC